MLCDLLVELALSRGIDSISGTYIPSAKNALVKNLYQQLGFEPTGVAGEVQIWHLDPRTYEFKNPKMKIENCLI